jgi:HlyD family secretion protein
MAKSNKSSRRIWIIIGGLFILLIAVVIGGKAAGLFGDSQRGFPVDAEEASIRDITQVVTASGHIQPEVEVKLSPDVSGEIVYLGVREGQHVAKGEMLVRIKPDFYQAQFEQARAGVAQARAGLERTRADMLRAELDLNRARELRDRDVIPASEFDAVETTYAVAKANNDAATHQLESASARQRESAEQLSKTRIFSPMDGTVSMLNVELGERVVGTTQFAGTELLRIARLDQMEIEAEVNENDVVNVALNDTALIEVDAYPNRSFKGVVTEIANSARVRAQGTQEQVTNFPVKVRILDRHNVVTGAEMAVVSTEEMASPPEKIPEFRPGMSGTVDIYTETVEGCVAVPIQAVAIRDFSQLGQDDEDEAGASGAEDDAESPTAEKEEESEGEAEDGEEADDDQPRRASEDLRKMVFVISEDSKATVVEVETGISDDTHIQIRSGLEGGENVVIGPYSAVSRDLRDAQRVKIREGSGEGGPGNPS